MTQKVCGGPWDLLDETATCTHRNHMGITLKQSLLLSDPKGGLDSAEWDLRYSPLSTYKHAWRGRNFIPHRQPYTLQMIIVIIVPTPKFQDQTEVVGH